MKSKKLLWIDTDCGIDDSTAILICLNSPDVEIVGISCIGGNASVDLVAHNVLRTLKVYGSESEKKIPVYVGCQKALLTDSMHIPEIHGNDGLGDIDSKSFGVEEVPPIQKANGIFQMIETIRNHEHISVLTLGPLTNFAIAYHISPDIASHIDELVIMGGADDLDGNSTKFAEFNIRCDPEAAEIIFREFPQNKIILSTWSLTKRYGITGENYDLIFGQNDYVIQRWIAQTWKKALEHDDNVALMADPLAAFIVCYGDKAIEEDKRMKVDVPCFGDEIGATKCVNDENGARIVQKINFDLFINIMKNLLTFR
ncbi:hypothetical protein M9Y10_003818 [Tritrichomonas musculus]|uniref:Inosine/uridine-preferring nucleoside hydrolase domain-containing protein n=1 Tax=Tritrichomonas musculus TaxID=1915356 RepID=A0ABR2JT77_9EUKA